jgi:ribosome-binding ATPase YchF (GTP1/OBG family)
MFIGLVGKPSAGKSTLFKAITLMDVARANYPFTTIKPNSGIGFVKVDCVDKEFNTQCNPREGYCINHNRFVPVQILDVAGLVPGAHEGKGLGLEFLNDLSQADALIHVVDISGSLNERGEPVDKGSYDPANDIRFLEHELDMWYFQIFQKAWKKFTKEVVQQKEDVIKAIAKQFSGLRVNEEMIKEKMRKQALLEKPIINWTDDDLMGLTTELRKETKPIIIAANKIDVQGAEKNYMRVKEQFRDDIIVPCSAESELALKEAAKQDIIEYVPGENEFKILDDSKLNEGQKKGLEFIRKNVLNKFNKTGVQEVINQAVFDLLHYIAIFPGGVGKLEDSEGRVIPDCFLMPPKTTALSFAYHLHTDLGENFIRAINVKTKIAMKKNELLKNRDVIEIIHSK